MILKSNEFSGIVVSAKANYFNVEIDFSDKNLEMSNEIDSNSERILCTRRSKLKYHGHRINVGDNVLVENIDWNHKRGVVFKVLDRSTFLERPSVANVNNIIVILSLSQPSFDIDQALISYF